MLEGEPVSRCRGLLLLVVCLAAVGCRAKAPPYEGKTVAELDKMLKSSDPVAQAQGAFGLSLLGPEARGATPALIEALKNSDAAVRHVAALALGRIGPDAREAVPVLSEALRDSEWPVRREAALALGEIGPGAQSAVGPLQEARQDSDPLVQAALPRML